jgi:two-component system, chemotaxis family, response regulator PixH
MVKILVVEDTPSEMQLMTLYLRDNGYQVVSANNAKDGLELVTKEKPDIVITDVVMEGMNGFEFCRTLKKNPDTENIRSSPAPLAIKIWINCGEKNKA